MQYAAALPNALPGGDARALVELAVVAEESGWDAVLLEDYIVYQNQPEMPAHDPWLLLAAMAVRTSRIRLGTLVTAVARRRPWKLAKELVTLDHLSGGRAILGAGLGDSADMSLTYFGEATDARERATVLDEALDVIDGLWRGESFSYDGRHFQVQEVTLLPRPIQLPRIPIWVGGAYPNQGPMRRAARWDGACLYRGFGDGSAADTGEGLSPEDVRALRRYVEAHRTHTGPYDIVVGRQRREDEARERDYLRALADAGATWWQEWTPPDEVSTMRASIARGPLRID